MRYSGILMVLLVIVALSVSGCSSGSGTATPTPVPGGSESGTPTPAPESGGPATTGQLFNTNDLHMYEYKMTTDVNGQSSSTTKKIEYSDGTYQGTPAKLTKMTYDVPGSGQIIVNMYYDKGDDHLLGGSYTMNVGGQNIEIPIGADEGSSYAENDWATTTKESIGDTSLASSGTETLTANGGQAYTCTKYTWSAGPVSYNICYTPQAPMPMKYQWTDGNGNSWTMELISWS
jgi:hypothetical protein